MKRLDTSASTDATASSAYISETTVAVPGNVDERRAARASNDANGQPAISAVEAMALCMAESTLGG